ncbi:MAG: [protein-PII] uridylyltransferase [Magnetovibrionaceae bacterium]
MKSEVRPRKPREIIDRRHLTLALDATAAEVGGVKSRSRVLELLKQALGQGSDAVRRRFEANEDKGMDCIRAQAFLIDQLVRLIHDFSLKHVHPSKGPEKAEDKISVLATGGYGRGGLAPFSDVDLMFLLPTRESVLTRERIEFMLYMLWDLGLKVGHATRSIKECVHLAKDDLTIRTALLEARWIWGNEALFDQFKQTFHSDVLADTGPAFVEEKLGERDTRHDKMGDTRYVLEPNVKEGKGGLRDLQTLFWCAKYLYRVESVRELVDMGVLSAADAKRFAKAENFLWTVRCHLHYRAGRPEERLTFGVQGPIGEAMGYRDRAGLLGVERFMKHYFLVAKDVGDLTRILCAVMEDRHQKRRFRLPTFGLFQPNVDGFTVDGGRLVANPETLTENPVEIIRLFREAQVHGLDIHPETLRWITQNLKLINAGVRNDPAANRLFLEIMVDKNQPEVMLMRMNEAGVFGKFVPDFGRVVAQMQYDMYHVYTVDEHTIRALAILARIERGELQEDHPLATEIMPTIQARRVLYVSVLLHDIAKGRGGDHSELGAKIALKLCPRFGLNEWETETVSWLVLHHLDMSRTAFKRDPDDPQTIETFGANVQTPERLKLLLVLTVVDIRAVGPQVWNEWKAGLLREIYYKTEEALTGGASADRRHVRVNRARGRLAGRLESIGWDKADIDAHLDRGYGDYWLAHDMDTLVRQADMIREAERAAAEGLTQGVLHVSSYVDLSRDVTELTIYTADHPGLFARITGAIALSGLSIVDSKIATLANGMALDIITLIDPEGHAVDEASRLNRVTARIESAVRCELDLDEELAERHNSAGAKRTRLFKVPPRVLVDNKASATHTVIEISTLDRPGLLVDICRAMTALGLQISSARINTYGEKASDVFYVKDVFGLKVDGEDKLKRIRLVLLETVAPGVDAERLAAE